MQRQAHTRETILTIVAVVLTAFLAVTGVRSAEGQQLRKMPPIGLLVYGNPPPAPSQEQQVIEGLRDLGWVDGQTMRLVIRYAEGRPERLPALTRELVEARVDLIVGVGTDVAKVVRSVTDTLPLVMSVSEDPVEIGLVASLSRPGGNLTGVTFISAEMAAKRLELLKEVVPQAVRVVVLWNPAHVDLEFKELELAGRAFGITLQSVEVRSPEEWDGAFRAVASARADALVVVPSRMINHNAKRIAAFALEQRLPTVSLWRSFAEAGGLMSYGPNIGAMVRRTAAHVDKILKGAKPGDLPIERPTHFELVVNLKTAQALSLTISPLILFQADEVIR
jgi:putative tryptophan/tyrosine transport system substrate-binding protein